MPGPERYFYGSVTKPLLYEEVIRKLLEVIGAGHIKPGEKFPPDRVLAAQWQVSGAVLREAFHVLGQRGITTSIQGKGRFLRAMPEEEPEPGNLVRSMEKRSVRHIYEVRKVLELHALGLAAGKATERDIAALQALHKKLARRFHKTGKTTGEFELHLAYVRLSGNYYLEKMVALGLKWINDFMSSTLDEVLVWHRAESVIQATVEDHRLIIDHLRRGDAPAAQAVMSDHIDRTMARVEAF